MRKFFLAALLMGLALVAKAQSGTNSPYSQFGLGVMSDQTSGFNRGMNGVALGFHEHNQINYLNPASYSNLDSLTFIFDAGMSGEITNFSENGVRKNAKDAHFEYVVAGFRVMRHLGVSFGVVPFTAIGYDYATDNYWVDNKQTEYYSVSYSGEGGLHQAFVGAGWQPIKGLSVGANISYLWGNIDKYASFSLSDSYANSLVRTYNSQMHSYKVDLGVQYTHRITPQDEATVGLTFSPGHNLGASADMKIISANTTTSTADTAAFSIDKAYKLPNMYGVGLMWNHKNQLKVGFDYTLQQWGKLQYPTFENGTYALRDNIYMNRSKYNVGLQYCYGERNRKFLKRVQYRLGASYATPYYKVNGVDGPKEISVSAGFGIPIINNYNNRSYLNISGQWVRSSAKSLITENSFRINVGFTFNELWFQKWKMK